MMKLNFINGEIFIFDVEDWAKLRKEHRIVGQITGSTSFIPSLPAKILPEEALLLLNKSIAVVYEFGNREIDDLKEKQFEEEFLKAQQIEYRKVRKQQLETVIDKIVKKRHEMGDKRSKDDIFNDELIKSSTVTRDNMLWPIVLQRDYDLISLVSYETIQSLVSSLRTVVFRDLWERGYFITSGEKFGGDFLVYYGDPITHHAIFIVKCVQGEVIFNPTELIAFGRLGVAVKKRAVLASVKDNKVVYITINWIDA